MNLDQAFSKYIRLRDCVKPFRAKPTQIAGRCSTCKMPVIVWNFMDGYNPNAHCGHFVSRNYQSTRYNEMNAHLQCAECNTVGLGKPKEMAEYIDKKYGPGTSEELIFKSKKLTKLFPFEKNELRDFYRKEVSKLEKELGII